MMCSQPPLWLDVLGHVVQVDIGGDPEMAALAHERAAAAWGELGSVRAVGAQGGGAAGDDGANGGDASSGVTRLEFIATDEASIENLLDQLSSRATLAGIEARSGELLMLHAAGLADPATGRVVACVAPSGTGKTTLSRSAAGTLQYVTDETVAVSRDGRVTRYPKPLSVKRQVEGWAPKDQRHPSEFGLTVAPAGGLSLGAIVLLRRVRDEAVSIAGESSADESRAEAVVHAGVTDGGIEEVLPRFEPMDLFDAIVALVPELSYLSRMQKPLRWLAETIGQVGGVRRFSYREAELAVPALRELLVASGEAGVGPGAGDDVGDGSGGDLGQGPAELSPIAASEAEEARWLQVIERPASGEREGQLLPAPTASMSDMLIDPATARVLTFGGNTVRVISSIAAVTLMAAERGFSLAQLRECLTALFGDPGAGDPTAAVVESLKEHGLLAAAD